MKKSQKSYEKSQKQTEKLSQNPKNPWPLTVMIARNSINSIMEFVRFVCQNRFLKLILCKAQFGQEWLRN